MPTSIRLVSRLVALALATTGLVLSSLMASPPASASLYPGGEQSYACTSPGLTSVWHVSTAGCRPDGTGGATPRALSDFDDPDVFDVYGAVGFRPNFLIWAPQVVKTESEVGSRSFGGCDNNSPKGKLCRTPIDFDLPDGSPSTVSHLWSGSSTLKYWDGAFISLICGNPSESGAGKSGPIPKISGTKYEDVNGNGTQDVGEPGVSGVTVRIYRDGHYVAATTTGANGYYEFTLNANANSGYTAGTYSLREDVPAGWQQKESPRTQYVPYGAADTHYRDFDFGNQKKIDVGIVKTSETPITIAGEETSWFLRVTNHSSYHAAPNTVVTDTLPAGFTEITEIDSRCTVSGISFTCPLGTLAASASTTIRLKSRTDPGLPKGTQLVNWAYVDTPHDTNPDNDSDDDDTEIDTEADVSIVKEADAVYYDGGDAITYILTVRSAGPSYALDVRAVDTVPADIEVVSAVDADAPGACSISGGQQIDCDLGTLVPGAVRTITVTGTVRGTPPGTGPRHDHQITVGKVSPAWSLSAGQSGAFHADCPSGTFLTDLTWQVTNVDQGAGDPQSVLASEVRATSEARGTVILENTASGQAQGHLYAACVTRTTGTTSGHTHQLETLPDTSSPVTSLPEGESEVTVEVPLNYTAVAPGYVVTAGRARLVASELTDTGWSFVFDVPDGTTAQVQAFVRPLHRRTSPALSGADRHEHTIPLEHLVRSVSAPPGHSTHRITCPDGFKGITATYDTPFYNGSDPQPVNRDFYLYNPGPSTEDAVIDLLCLGSITGPPVDEQEYVDNTGTVSSSTDDPDPADNSSSTRVVVTRALGSALPFSGPTASPSPVTSSSQGAVRVSRTFVQRGRVVVGRVACAQRCRAVVQVKIRGHRNKVVKTTVGAGKTAKVRVRLPRHASARVVVVRVAGTKHITSVRHRRA